jgi:hypothetical protein
MTNPEQGPGDSARPDALDRLHEQGKRRATEVPQFDAEETLNWLRSRMPPPAATEPAAISPAAAPAPPDSRLRALALSVSGPRGFRLKLEITRPAGRERGSPPARLGRGTTSVRSGREAGRRDTGSVNFWESLGPAEREAFRSRARERSFAQGARLMREGETADHVVAILSGRTAICVGSGDVEYTIAERGPGQLVGERAALQVSVRSATVVALEQVRALVMTTADFASFVSAHPSVLDIVEAQVYERLTETLGRTGRRAVSRPDRPDRAGLAGIPPAALAGRAVEPFRPPLRGENCTVVYTGVVGSAAGPRGDDDHLTVRNALGQMLGDALGGIWSASHRADHPDGFLVVIPSAVPTADVLDRLRIQLPDALRHHNEDRALAARLRLRAAVDVGPVVSDLTGVSGDVIRRAARLLTAPALKRAMNKNKAAVGVIVSDFIYETAVRQVGSPVVTSDYEEIQADVKQADLTTRIQLIA